MLAHLRHRWTFFASLIALLGPTLRAMAAPPIEQERLDRLIETLEKARVANHIPGMALALVKDDEVLLVHGFGVADIEKETPVTPETIFAIGSTTKAFTATLIGMLVDDGLMSWDDPVTSYLPDFSLKVKGGDEDDQVLIRDMLSHRTGFTRMSMLFIGGEASREEILATASNAEPWADFREKFLYNNVMYMAAGVAAGNAAGSTWENLIHTRIFAPLGMRDATLRTTEAKKDPRLARGYQWDEALESWDALPMRKLDAIGPAGAINANVIDVAKWIRLQLNRGVFEGRRLISEDSLTETWKKHTTIAPDTMAYGLGWMIRDWNGMTVVEHGGNIDGFAAQIAMIPEERIGYVLLMNVSFSTLQGGSIATVFDTLLGDVEESPETSASEVAVDDLSQFEGTYIANYAHFENERFTVAINDEGQLTLDIPSQQRFVLGEQNEQGRRPFVGIPGIAASFERDDNGEVTILRLYQGGLKFDVPREGFEFPVEVPLDELEKYLGTYHFKEQNHDVSVLIRNNHLAVDVPDQLVFELHPPNDDGRWVFRNSDVVTIAVSFNEDAFGTIESMTFHQAGKHFILPKLASPEGDTLPTIAEVMALCGLDRRQAALRDASIIEFTGVARMPQSGLVGKLSMAFDADSHFRSDLDFGTFARITAALARDRAWSDTSFGKLEELHGELFQMIKREHPRVWLGDWSTLFDAFRVDRAGTIDGIPTIVVMATHQDDPTTTIHIDRSTGDILQINSTQHVPGMPIRIPVTTTFSEWRNINGLRMPFKIAIENEANGRTIMDIRSVRANAAIPPERFVLETQVVNDD